MSEPHSEFAEFDMPAIPLRSRAGMADSRLMHGALNHFPLKHLWNFLAVSQLVVRGHYTVAEKIRAVRFFFDAGGINNLYASLTRSGNAWSQLGLAIAYDLSRGGDGGFSYDPSIHLWVPRNGLIYTKLDWREATANRSGIGPIKNPVLFHTHHPYFRVRSARLKKLKTVILLRDIYASMESKYFKLAKIPDHPDEDDDQRFAWEKLTIDAIEFFNSWGEVARWHPNCLVFRYEDLLADPVGAHKRMADHWQLGVPGDCFVEAFSRITKDKMREIMQQQGEDKNYRVSSRGECERIPDHRRRLVESLIAEKLNYDFGYDYE